MVGNIDGIIWSQGEAEGASQETADAYEAAMLAFIDALRESTQKPQLPFLIVQTGRFCTMGSPQPNPYWEQVRETQRRLTMLRSHVFTVSSLDVTLDDPIHISAQGHAELARRLAEVALTEVYGLAGHGRMLQLESIERVDPETIVTPPCFDRPYQFRVQFRGVSGALASMGRPTGFEIRWPQSTTHIPMLYRTQFDPDRPNAVILSVGLPGAPLPDNLTLIYGSGLDPYVNIVDSSGMPIPAFGPVKLPDENTRVLTYE